MPIACSQVRAELHNIEGLASSLRQSVELSTYGHLQLFHRLIPITKSVFVNMQSNQGVSPIC